MKPTTKQLTPNQIRARVANLKNNTPSVIADLVVINHQICVQSSSDITGREIFLDDGVTYKFDNIRIWNPKTQQWHQYKHDMSVTSEDFDTAKKTFWQRYAQWSGKQFRAYIKPEIRNTLSFRE